MRGNLTSVATKQDRTLFFDLLPLEVGKIGDFTIRLQLYTVPGQVYYNASRKIVLKGVDGVVFVADSQRGKMEENIESLQNLEDNLVENGVDPSTIPVVLQFNKRDLPDVTTIEDLNNTLNKNSLSYFEAIAITGHGVFNTLKEITKLVIFDVKRKLSNAEKGSVEQKEEQVREPVNSEADNTQISEEKPLDTEIEKNKVEEDGPVDTVPVTEPKDINAPPSPEPPPKPMPPPKPVSAPLNRSGKKYPPTPSKIGKGAKSSKFAKKKIYAKPKKQSIIDTVMSLFKKR
jgi:signal recognition particle receptor subunit beta